MLTVTGENLRVISAFSHTNFRTPGGVDRYNSLQVFAFGGEPLKRFGYITCVTAALLALPASFAGTLLNENFENAAGLADGNWANPGSAQIVTDPQNAGNKVV